MRWSMLGGPPVLERKSEHSARGRANTIGAAVRSEQEPAAPRGEDQVAAAIQTGMAVLVVELDVPADLLKTAQDLPAGPEKEIVSNHGE